MRTGGSSPYPYIGRGDLVPAYYPPRNPEARPLWAVEPGSDKALLSLALYREGLCASPAIFQYLSFFKILETRVSGGRNLKRLLEQHLPQARRQVYNPPHGDRTDRELAAHMFENGRCAVAHAHRDPLVDPDDPRGTGGIAAMLPLMQKVAEIVIEKEHSVPRWPTNSYPAFREATEEDGLSLEAFRTSGP